MALPSSSQAHAPVSVGPSTLTTLGVFVGGLLLIGSLANFYGAQNASNAERMKTMERDLSETRYEVKQLRAENQETQALLRQFLRGDKTASSRSSS